MSSPLSTALRLCAFCFLTAAGFQISEGQSASATLPGVRYLGEVGHLGTDFNPRTSVDFAVAKATTIGDGDLEFSGKDDLGEKWTARFPVIGGIGWTAVWKADFDHNGRPDLMVASHFPGNGRCTENVTVSFLMIDGHGKPNPWTIHTNVPRETAFPPMPVLLTDLNGDGHFELIATDCQYAPGPKLGEDHSITGVYEARDSAWKLAPPSGIAARERVTAIVHQASRLRPDRDKLLPIDAAHWSNLGNDHPRASGQITDVLLADAGCRVPVRVGPIVDGDSRPANEHDPCEERSENRLRLSNGATCYGWPTVVIDSRDGREIVAGESRRISVALHNIAAQHLAVSLSGEAAPGRCSPVLLSAESH